MKIKIQKINIKLLHLILYTQHILIEYFFKTEKFKKIQSFAQLNDVGPLEVTWPNQEVPIEWRRLTCPFMSERVLLCMSFCVHVFLWMYMIPDALWTWQTSCRKSKTSSRRRRRRRRRLSPRATSRNGVWEVCVKFSPLNLLCLPRLLFHFYLNLSSPLRDSAEAIPAGRCPVAEPVSEEPGRMHLRRWDGSGQNLPGVSSTGSLLTDESVFQTQVAMRL